MYALCGFRYAQKFPASVNDADRTPRHRCFEEGLQMRIPRRNFFSQSLILLIFSGFLFSSYTLSGRGPRPVEILHRARSFQGARPSYEQYAALIAGIRTPQSILAPFERRPVWTEFAKSFDHEWEKYDKMQLAPMREWAASELAKSVLPGSPYFIRSAGRILSPPTPFSPARGPIS